MRECDKDNWKSYFLINLQRDLFQAEHVGGDTEKGTSLDIKSGDSVCFHLIGRMPSCGEVRQASMRRENTHWYCRTVFCPSQSGVKQ